MIATSLIAGLGNPGADYERTRHNAGFVVVEALATAWRIPWREESRFEAMVARADREAGAVRLVRPLTYMNVSGRAVGALAKFYRVPLERTLVVVDDADLPLGAIRMRPGGSAGGHRGLTSVEAHLGTREYARLRVGIGRADPEGREIAGYVLGRFAAEEWETLERVVPRAVAQIACWLDEGIEKAMARYNGSVE